MSSSNDSQASPSGKAGWAVISLGSNLPSRYGSPENTLEEAISRLRALVSEEIVGSTMKLDEGSVEGAIANGFLSSSLYLTEPCDCEPGTPDFVNAAVALRLDSVDSAQDLLRRLLAIEVEFGRQLDSDRGKGLNLARSLDLDLICFGELQVSGQELTLPHPRACQRRFVLEPIAEILPRLVLPGQQLSVFGILQELSATEAVEKI
jgi:2-amino-4-hydroxy-6-hydroxymethyldihydropteridine diphosphokinase